MGRNRPMGRVHSIWEIGSNFLGLLNKLTMIVWLGLISSSLVHAGVYSWIDENGVRRFSNTMPPEQQHIDVSESEEIASESTQGHSANEKKTSSTLPGKSLKKIHFHRDNQSSDSQKPSQIRKRLRSAKKEQKRLKKKIKKIQKKLTSDQNRLAQFRKQAYRAKDGYRRDKTIQSYESRIETYQNQLADYNQQLEMIDIQILRMQKALHQATP